jgi:FKBP-type peptidyl-prolyl cis-trans isomerase 2
LADFEKNGYKLEKGVELPTQYGMLKITDVKDDIVYLDTNHPLCGKKLIFTVTLKEIK